MIPETQADMLRETDGLTWWRPSNLGDRTEYADDGVRWYRRMRRSVSAPWSLSWVDAADLSDDGHVRPYPRHDWQTPPFSRRGDA